MDQQPQEALQAGEYCWAQNKSLLPLHAGLEPVLGPGLQRLPAAVSAHMQMNRVRTGLEKESGAALLCAL